MSLQAYPQFMERQHPAGYRQAEIQKLVHAINARENRLIIALPGMGASNLLRYLVTRPAWADRQVSFAYLNCAALGQCRDQGRFFEESPGSF